MKKLLLVGLVSLSSFSAVAAGDWTVSGDCRRILTMDENNMGVSVYRNGGVHIKQGDYEISSGAKEATNIITINGQDIRVGLTAHDWGLNITPVNPGGDKYMFNVLKTKSIMDVTYKSGKPIMTVSAIGFNQAWGQLMACKPAL